MNRPSAKLGCLYGVGVGPGDPRLLTLRAVEVIRQTPVLCVPRAAASGESLALTIAAAHLTPSHEILRLPFPTDDPAGAAASWQEGAGMVAQRLRGGPDVAFLTEGDPMLFSTFAYVMAGVAAECPEAAIEVIPGISSVMAAAARARIPLAAHDQRLAILPAAYGVDDLAEAARQFETLALLKVNRPVIDAVRQLLAAHPEITATYIRRATTDREEIAHNLDDDLEADYFSLLLLKTRPDSPEG